MLELPPDLQIPVRPVAQYNAFGREFLETLEPMFEPPWLWTDAPWYIRLHAWLPAQTSAVVLHSVNYRQAEHSDIEVPEPVGPLQVACAVPEASRVEKVEWLYPEKREGIELPHVIRADRVHFTIPSLIVYGLSIVHLTE